ncbi:MAG: ribosomal protein S18-alanine N-acetyltransferase [Halieaceae bacterium]|jgi:ribosomal-protein-alanine N-acetyltransferase|nr:ribosomal protein S18-alanine N-acetyltransferase [Halieaceae bacterium]
MPRPALPGDALPLAALDGLVNPSPWSESQFSDACNPQAAPGTERALVICDNAQPRGFIVFSRVLDEACIHNIAVHPSRQGCGMARSLLDAALRRAAGEGATRCYLEVRVSNGAARGLYQTFGFRIDGVRKNYYTTAAGREDALLMSLPLGELECRT